MAQGQRLKVLCTVFAIACVAITISLTPSQRVKAEKGGSNGDSRVQIGLEAAPVPLNMEGKNPAQVGLGSYLVNVAGDCNGCHSAGPPTEYAPGHNPYQLVPGSNPPVDQPQQINPATYLGGGRDFGFLGPPSNSNTAHIISRNLTPDSSGLPEGSTFDQFVAHIRTGVDDDNRHPTCPGPPGTPPNGCVPYPFDGRLLQIMPWTNFKDMSDQNLRAIYEYLKAVPCIEGNDPYDKPGRCG